MHLDAPLANRLGIWQLKGELEDLAFQWLEPQKFQAIATQLESDQKNRERLVRSAVTTLQAQLDEGGINAVVTGRSKHIYSIYRKMERKGIGLDETYDIYGLRVVVDPVLGKSTEFSDRQLEAEARDLCYQALGVVHNLWQPIPQEFDDYIAAPKLNGYRSLHTTVVDENGQTQAWATCPSTENGFVRVASNPRYPNQPGEVPVVLDILRRFCALDGHQLYLLGLTVEKGGKLATLDRRIPADIIQGGPEALTLVAP